MCFYLTLQKLSHQCLCLSQIHQNHMTLGQEKGFCPLINPLDVDVLQARRCATVVEPSYNGLQESMLLFLPLSPPCTLSAAHGLMSMDQETPRSLLAEDDEAVLGQVWAGSPSAPVTFQKVQKIG